MVFSVPFPGELAALTAALIWAGSLVGFKKFGVGLPARESNLFKSAVATVGFLALVPFSPAPPPPDSGPLWTLALSGVIGITLGDTFFFSALSRLGAQLTAVTQCLSPVVAALLAWVFLDEALDGSELLGMALTLVAVAASVWMSGRRRLPTGGSLGSGVAFAVASAVGNGTGIVLAREALPSVGVAQGTLLRVAPALALLIPLWWFQRTRTPWRQLLQPRTRLAALLLSAFGGSFLGLLLMSIGVKYAKAGVAAALSITYPIWVLPLGHYFLGERAQPVGTLWVILAVVGAGLMFL